MHWMLNAHACECLHLYSIWLHWKTREWHICVNLLESRCAINCRWIHASMWVTSWHDTHECDVGCLQYRMHVQCIYICKYVLMRRCKFIMQPTKLMCIEINRYIQLCMYSKFVSIYMCLNAIKFKFIMYVHSYVYVLYCKYILRTTYVNILNNAIKYQTFTCNIRTI